MNGILLINKPQNITSFGVVNKIKQLTRMKVGHSGTLDPNATGLLIILVGSATKLTPFLNQSMKTYEATCLLGKRTDTGDIWGETLEVSEVPKINDTIDSVLKSFVGKSQQKVPKVSAVRLGGKRLYEYHRNKLEVETPMRSITISEIELLAVDETSFTFRATVSSGTYIRTLCEDIAVQLGTIGTMSALNRIKIGTLDLENAVSIEQLTPENWNNHLMSKKEALSGYEMVEVKQLSDIINGKPIVLDSHFDEVVVLHQDEAIAIYERIEKTSTFKIKRGLW